MISRKYTKRVEIYGTTEIYDGFAGSTVSTALLGSSWCHIKTVSRDRYVNLGLQSEQQAIEVYLRHRNDLDYMQDGIFLKYNGKEWVISSLTDMDLEGVEIRLMAISRPNV